MLATVQLVEAATARWAETLTVRNTPAHAWAQQLMPVWMQRLFDVVQGRDVPLVVKQFVCKVGVLFWGGWGDWCVCVYWW